LNVLVVVYVCLYAFLFAVVLFNVLRAVLGALGYARKPTVRSCVRASLRIFLIYLLIELIVVIANAEQRRLVVVRQEEIRRRSVKGVLGAGLSLFGVVAAKFAAGAALPAVMSSTGTVVAGVGTFHGALTAAVASFAATPMGWPLAIGAAALGFFGF
jgi:hypothetical protein